MSNILTVRGDQIAAIWQGLDVYGWSLHVTLNTGAKLALTYDHDELEDMCAHHDRLFEAMQSGEMVRVGSLP